MSYLHLPTLNEHTHLSRDAALQDRVQIELGGWVFHGDRLNLEMALVAIERLTETITVNGEPHSDNVFGRRQRRSPYSTTINTRALTAGNTRRLVAPLFQGVLQFRHQYSSTDNVHCRISARLALNPTRALNHQTLLHDIYGAGSHERQYPSFELFTRHTNVDGYEEYSMDRNDNVIVGLRRRLLARAPHWQHYLESYVHAVVRYIDDLLYRAFWTEERLGQLIRQRSCSVQSTETYWEFQSDDPQADLAAFEPHFHALGTESHHRLYPDLVAETTYPNNTSTLQCRLAEGVTAKLYGKTNRRLRLEVTHDLQRARIFPRHTGVDIASIIAFIDAAAENAAREANLLLEGLRSAFPTNAPQQSPVALVRTIVQASHNVSHQEALLSAIIHHNGLRCPPNHPLRQAVIQLVRQEVLARTRPYSQSFRVTEAYAAACHTLAADRDQPYVGRPRP